MFTTDNTEGFTVNDLAVMNEALDSLMAEYEEGTDDYVQMEKHFSDKISDAFADGDSPEDVVRKIRG